jgi:hypothetical protein
MNFREYGVYRVNWSASRYMVCEEDARHTPLFFINTTNYCRQKGRPNLSVHVVQPAKLGLNTRTDGRLMLKQEGFASPVIATARLDYREIHLTFGDAADPENQYQETVKHRSNFGIPPSHTATELMRATDESVSGLNIGHANPGGPLSRA